MDESKINKLTYLWNLPFDNNESRIEQMASRTAIVMKTLGLRYDGEKITCHDKEIRKYLQCKLNEINDREIRLRSLLKELKKKN